jgi:hypothetical protein
MGWKPEGPKPLAGSVHDSPAAKRDVQAQLLLIQLASIEETADCPGDTSSGKKLRRWVTAAVIAWAAHPMGATFVRMEAHMEASITLKVQSEAHGIVGPVGVRRSHASNSALTSFH